MMAGKESNECPLSLGWRIRQIGHWHLQRQRMSPPAREPRRSSKKMLPSSQARRAARPELSSPPLPTAPGRRATALDVPGRPPRPPRRESSRCPKACARSSGSGEATPAPRHRLRLGPRLLRGGAGLSW